MTLKKIIFCLLCALIISYFFSNSTKAVQDDGVYTYKLYIYYDGQVLSAVKKGFIPYDVITGSYSQTGPIKGEVDSIEGNKLATFTYDLILGNNQILAPYFPNAAKIVLTNPAANATNTSAAIRTSPNPTLTIDVSGSLVCNENKICDAAAGETYLNCPSDCPAPTAVATTMTTVSSHSYIFLWLGLIGIGVIVIGAIALLYYVNYKK
jgi:hypothetical protein